MTQAVDLDAVGRTALVTASMRATESSRPDAIYRDPYAAVLAGDLGPALLAELVGAASANAPRSTDPRETSPQETDTRETNTRETNTRDYNAIRTRVFDDYLLAAADEPGLHQIVVAGAGMDSRAYRLPLPEGVRYFEVDRAAVLDYKRDRLAGVAPKVEPTAVRVDLTSPDWPAALLEAGYRPDQPSAWLLEGLLFYIPEDGVHRVLDQVAELAAPGSRIAADVVNAAALTIPSQRLLLDVFESWGCPWLFGCDEPEALFERHGFKATVLRPGEPGAEFGRWPDPVPPRGAAGVRQVYFVIGRRS